LAQELRFLLIWTYISIRKQVRTIVQSVLQTDCPHKPEQTAILAELCAQKSFLAGSVPTEAVPVSGSGQATARLIWLIKL
jgi:hypothetical protein